MILATIIFASLSLSEPTDAAEYEDPHEQTCPAIDRVFTISFVNEEQVPIILYLTAKKKEF